MGVTNGTCETLQPDLGAKRGSGASQDGVWKAQVLNSTDRHGLSGSRLPFSWVWRLNATADGIHADAGRQAGAGRWKPRCSRQYA